MMGKRADRGLLRGLLLFPAVLCACVFCVLKRGKGKFRAYPVRKGETIEDIIEKRGIKMHEVEALNEDVDLCALKGKS